MKLITSIAAMLALASSNPIYTTQPTEHFANNAEAYQSALEQQQQGVYGDQSRYSQQDYSQSQAGYSQGHTVAFPTGQNSFAGQSTYSGAQNAFNGQNLQQEKRVSTERSARIISFQNENKGNSYQYSYETENGIKVQERGQTQGKGIQAQGGYSYTGDDGQVYTVTYTADENGFRAQGSHLPTPPPIPEAIMKSIEQNAKDQANGVFDDGSYKEENELKYTSQQIQQQQQQIQHVQTIQQAQPIQHVQPIQQIQHAQPIQEIQQAQHIPQVQLIQLGQEQYENPAYQQEYQQEYPQEYHQEITGTTAGYYQ